MTGVLLELDTVQKIGLLVIQEGASNHIHDGHLAPFLMPEP